MLLRALQFLTLLGVVAFIAVLPKHSYAIGTLYDAGTNTGVFDNGEANFTQQHATSIRNIQFTGSPAVCSVKVYGLTVQGSPTDALEVDLYEQSSAWFNGDLTGGFLLATTSLTGTEIANGSSTFEFSRGCPGGGANYYFGFYFHRTGAENDTNFYKIGYIFTSPANMATFTAGAWGDLTPATKGAIAVYGIGSIASYDITLITPANGSAVNPFTRFLTSATSFTSTTLRVIYQDTYGGTWVATTSPFYSPDVYTNVNVPVPIETLHPGNWTAKAYILSASSSILAQSSWNSFQIVQTNYAAVVASTSAQVAGGLFALETCSGDDFLFTTNVNTILCDVRNSLRSLANIIYSNAIDLTGRVGTLLKGGYPFVIFYDIENAFTNLSCSTSTAPILIPVGVGKTLTLISTSTIETGVAAIGFGSFKAFSTKMIWLLMGAVLFIIAVLVIRHFKE